jgi:hypothetical protein
MEKNKKHNWLVAGMALVGFIGVTVSVLGPSYLYNKYGDDVLVRKFEQILIGIWPFFATCLFFALLYVTLKRIK